jgi:hypothetical protein
LAPKCDAVGAGPGRGAAAQEGGAAGGCGRQDRDDYACVRRRRARRGAAYATAATGRSAGGCAGAHCRTGNDSQCARIERSNGRVLEWGSFRVGLQDVDMPGLAMSLSSETRWPDVTIVIALVGSVGRRGNHRGCRLLLSERFEALLALFKVAMTSRTELHFDARALLRPAVSVSTFRSPGSTLGVVLLYRQRLLSKKKSPRTAPVVHASSRHRNIDCKTRISASTQRDTTLTKESVLKKNAAGVN